MDGTLGEIRIFAGTFPPRNWAYCQGQVLQIAEYNALYALLGTYYGGDGRTTMGLPDLRGRTPIGQGAGPGLPSYSLGQFGGYYNTQLDKDNIPSHNHSATFTPEGGGSPVTGSIKVNTDETESKSPKDGYLGMSSSNLYASESTGTDVLAGLELSGGGGSGGTVAVANTGIGSQFNNMQPYLTLSWIICIDGLFPQRS